MLVLIIDNYDSFTYNLYQYVGEILSSKLGFGHFNVLVKRNNEITLEEIQQLDPDRIIISPGPGSPDDRNYFGVCSDVILQLGKTIPLLGVCLGMQGIAHCFGGMVVRAPVPMHGKTSLIQHDGRGVYHNIPQALEIMRYHSLMVEAQSLPDCLEITSVIAKPDMPEDLAQAALAGCEIMGLRHRQFPIEGIQYHPESFATEGGRELLRNFLLPEA
ncbi:aminodeoxychorismate/anthranilate synthase component II [Saccharophagus sp. K07]|uniref:anthranilate synthase component II n=1 Tax=Saccharophagus sp. K07 TaxID=2283636 RepID=UPI001652AC67|nr:aminodeoxychorismate/anthranilate synthase component II [Saccharophagus sp. K07]MBC6904262.1 aminodeoxychorismate/anthranilate synthase component II [Saccharophagus sp. K07]